MKQQPVLHPASPEFTSAPAFDRPRAAAGAPPRLQSMLPNDPAFTPIIAEFVVDLQRKLAQMDAAASREDFKELKRLGHWLKGTGPTLGFATLGDVGRELEAYAQAVDLVAAKRLLAELRLTAEGIEIPAPSGSEPRA